MICVPITASKTEAALKEIRESKAGLIELRLDFIKDINEENLVRLMKRTRKKTIVTDRKMRLSLLKKAIEMKADYIDIDYKEHHRLAGRFDTGKTKLIISFHDFRKTDMRRISSVLAKIKKLNPDIIKLVSRANSINDNFAIFDILKKNKKTVAFCMGEKGKISRILCIFFGSAWTYGSLSEGRESAPGQIPADELRSIYRIHKLQNPKIYGLVGNPVEHSIGIFVHNRAFEKTNINAVYVNFLVEELLGFVRKARGLFSGFSVTIPFKKSIIPMLDKLDPIAAKIGAVNTIIKRNDGLIGYNTDIAALESLGGVRNKKVILIGAGGGARAIAFGIKKKKGKLTIINRTVSKARKLAAELNCEYMGLKKVQEIRRGDILINCTPIGMHPYTNRSPVGKNTLKKILKKKATVFDIIYNPIKTKLLKEADALGFRTISGVDMFVDQAAEQYRLWTNRKAPRELMKKILLKHLK